MNWAADLLAGCTAAFITLELTEAPQPFDTVDSARSRVALTDAADRSWLVDSAATARYRAGIAATTPVFNCWCGCRHRRRYRALPTDSLLVDHTRQLQVPALSTDHRRSGRLYNRLRYAINRLAAGLAMVTFILISRDEINIAGTPN